MTRAAIIGVALAIGLLLEAFWVTRAYGAALIGFASGVALCAFWPEVERGVRSVYERAIKPLFMSERSNLSALLFGVTPGIMDRNSPQTAQTGPIKSKVTIFANLVTGLGNIVGFLLTHWRPLVLILIAAAIIGGLRACSAPFDLGKSRGEIALEARLARAESDALEALNARDAIIAQAAQQAAVHRAQIELLLEQGHDEIEAATPAHEEPIDPELERAWRTALERLRVYPTLDPNSPDPGGPGA